MKSKKAAAIMLCAVLGTSMITGVSVSAKDKDELVLYTWDGMFPQEVLDDFEKETGTKVVYSNFDTDETMLEKLSQAKGGDYDVVIADDYIIDSAVKEGLVQKIDKDTVSNFKNINPLYQGQFYDPDDEYTVPYGAGSPGKVSLKVTLQKAFHLLAPRSLAASTRDQSSFSALEYTDSAINGSNT